MRLLVRPTKQENSSEHGMILLVVLWTVALMAIFAVAASTYVQRSLVSATADFDQLRTEFALRAAIASGAATILVMDENAQQCLNARSGTAELGDGAIVQLELTNVSGHADVNKAPADLLKAIFAAALASPASGQKLADAIMARRAAVNQSPDTPEIAQASVLHSTEELLPLGEFSTGMITKLATVADVASPDGKVNACAAPVAVLAAIPSLSKPEIETIMAEQRSSRPDPARFEAITKAHGDYLTQEKSVVFRVSARVTSGYGLISGSSVSALVLMTPDGAKPFEILSLSW